MCSSRPTHRPSPGSSASFSTNTHSSGNPAGFAQTVTTYPQSNPNLPAFDLKIGLPFAPVLPAGRQLGAAPFLGQGVAIDEKDGNIPRSQQFSLSIQQQLRGGWLIEATYSGNVGSGFTAGGYDLNQLDNQFLSQGLALQQQVPNPYAGRVPGAMVGTVDEALDYLKELERSNG